MYIYLWVKAKEEWYEDRVPVTIDYTHCKSYDGHEIWGDLSDATWAFWCEAGSDNLNWGGTIPALIMYVQDRKESIPSAALSAGRRIYSF